jgi:putative FmdB family regulatory protein
MPIYEYRCAKCDCLTETLRPMAEADQPMACEHCGSRQTARQHSVFSAQGGHRGEPAMAGAAGGGGDRCGSCSGGNCSCCH